MARSAGPTTDQRQPVAGRASAPLRRVRLHTALACVAFTSAVVLVRGGARRRRFVVRGHEHRLIAAMNTWTAVSRSLGIAALVLVAVTLPVGLLFGRRVVAAGRRPEVRAMHMTLSLSALTVVALHVVTLLGASALAPSLDRLVIPWVWPYRRTATALGEVAVYVLVLMGPTYYARRALGWQRWRIAHRFIAAGLALAILHVIGGG